MGLSGDGGALAIGDLHGRIRVFSFNGTEEKYEEIWTYRLPHSNYYPWVCAIDISKDGSILAMGSLEWIQDEDFGYLYVFDVAEGPPFLYKSRDFGDMVSDVAVSDCGEIAVGASWGPFEHTEQGWDLIAFSRNLGGDIYRMEGTYPGSLFACGINSSGTRVAAGGKRVHARQFGSGGWTYSIELEDILLETPTPTTTCTPSLTPTNTPTPTETPTPTCQSSGAWCELNKELYHSGDRFLLSITACNGSSEGTIQNPIFLILDVYGMYFCAPTWSDCFESLSYYDWEIDPCSCLEDDVFDFTWPPDVGEADNIYFYAAMVNNTFTDIIGEISICKFGWQ